MSHGTWLSLPERIGRLEATIESLIRENGELRRRVENATAAEEILRRAQAPPLPVPQRAPAAHKRDRHGLHVVRGLAAAGGAAVAWALRSRAHKAATFGLMAAVAAAGGVTPLVVPGSSPSVPARAHRAPPRVLPPVIPARPRRRSTSRSTAGTPSPSPAAADVTGGGAQPSPLVPAAPLPSPSVTPLPAPPAVPSPLCVLLPSAACDHNPRCVCGPDGDGDADDVLAAA